MTDNHSQNDTQQPKDRPFYLGAGLSISNQYLGLSAYIISDTLPDDPNSPPATVHLALSMKQFNNANAPYIVNLKASECLALYRVLSGMVKPKNNDDINFNHTVAERGKKSIALQFSRKDKTSNIVLFFNGAEGSQTPYLNLNKHDIKLVQLKSYEALKVMFGGISQEDFKELLG